MNIVWHFTLVCAITVSSWI